ncbi:unnamed protein product [Ectocarpus fasciculatus]
MSAVLPRLDHTTLSDFDNVYEPSDDTFLLCDALLADRDFITARDPRVVCEIGTGSGCVITYAYQLLEKHGSCPPARATYYATDINPAALILAQATAAHNEMRWVWPARCSLLYIWKSCCPNVLYMLIQVDVLIFNPPYVPTEDEEVDGSCGISASWAGGINGRLIIDKFLPMIKMLLRPGLGVCYLLLVKENKPKEICCILTAQGLVVEVLPLVSLPP